MASLNHSRLFKTRKSDRSRCKYAYEKSKSESANIYKMDFNPSQKSNWGDGRGKFVKKPSTVKIHHTKAVKREENHRHQEPMPPWF